MRPKCIYLTFTHTLPYAIPTLGIITLVSLGHRQTYSQQNNAAFSGAFLWNKLPLTVRSCHSLSFFSETFVYILKQLGWIVTKKLLGTEGGGERETEIETDRQRQRERELELENFISQGL